MKRIVSVGLLLVMTLSVAGCSDKYNAAIYDNAQKWMTEEYLQENMTHEWGGDENLPDDITRVITTQEEFDTIFTEFPAEVDFENQMIVLYFFTDIYMAFSCKVKKIENTDNTLAIKLIHEKANYPCTSFPTQRCVAIRMKKIAFDSVSISWKYKNI